MKLPKKIRRIWWTLVRWIAPRFVEIKMGFYSPLPDENYIVKDFTDELTNEPIKIKNGKIYRVE